MAAKKKSASKRTPESKPKTPPLTPEQKRRRGEFEVLNGLRQAVLVHPTLCDDPAIRRALGASKVSIDKYHQWVKDGGGA